MRHGIINEQFPDKTYIEEEYLNGLKHGSSRRIKSNGNILEG
jgi:hypothetical protein